MTPEPKEDKFSSERLWKYYLMTLNDGLSIVRQAANTPENNEFVERWTAFAQRSATLADIWGRIHRSLSVRRPKETR